MTTAFLSAVAKVGGDLRVRRLGACALAGIALLAVSGCASKDDDPSPPKYRRKPVRDPVEQRIYYEGWRHPT